MNQRIYAVETDGIGAESPADFHKDLRTSLARARQRQDGAGLRPWLRRAMWLSSRPRRHQMESFVLSCSARLQDLEENGPGAPRAIVSAREALSDAVFHISNVENTRALAALHRFEEIVIDHDPEARLRADLMSFRQEVATPQFAEIRPVVENLLAGLDDEGRAMGEEERARIRKAVALRNEQIERQFLTKSLQRYLLLLLGVVLSAILAATIWRLSLSFTMTQSDAGAYALVALTGGVPTNPFALAALLGAAGATLSAMMNFASSKEIPDVFTSFWVSLMRPLIGAASGLISVLIFSSGVVTLGAGPSALMLTAFAFGFSERLVLGAISRVDFRKGGV